MPEGAQPEVGMEPVGFMMVDAKLIISDPLDRLVSRCWMFFCAFFLILGVDAGKTSLVGWCQCDVG